VSVVHYLDSAAAESETLAPLENSPQERAAALRCVLRNTRTRLDEDEALWMLDLHYRPEPPKARRHPMYSSKVIPAAQGVPDGE
jgi:hypothetical protein